MQHLDFRPLISSKKVNDPVPAECHNTGSKHAIFKVRTTINLEVQNQIQHNFGALVATILKKFNNLPHHDDRKTKYGKQES